MFSTTVSRMMLWQEISKCLVELSTAVGDVDGQFERILWELWWNIDIFSDLCDRAECVGWIVYHSPCLQNCNLAIFMVLRFLYPWIGGGLWLSTTFLPFERLWVFLGHQSIRALGPRLITLPLSPPLCMPTFGAFFSSFFSLLWEGQNFPLPPQAAIYLVPQLGLGLPDPNPNLKPNPNANFHLKKLPLLVILSQLVEMEVYESRRDLAIWFLVCNKGNE